MGMLTVIGMAIYGAVIVILKDLDPFVFLLYWVPAMFALAIAAQMAVYRKSAANPFPSIKAISPDEEI
ncbi:MAG: hypothetical protein GY862_18515 [Gammaproteobacteria bacterium]|nr:hypothetical protein [Gammaproteobacteria bacterium]